MPSRRVSPILAHAEAARVWDLYGFQGPQDLVLEDLAWAMGVLVMDGPLDGADARLLRKGARGLIRVKDTLPERGRRRFAIAHELGHWLLHKNVSQVLACTSLDMVAQYQGSEPEIEANYFAAALLMPESLFGPRVRGHRPSAERVKSLAAAFDTSLTATAVRCVELADDYCAVVISEQGQVRWWRASADFAEHFWIDPGSPLSRYTVAGSIGQGEPVPKGPEEVDLECWLPGARGIESSIIVEEVISLDSYGQIISLLWLP